MKKGDTLKLCISGINERGKSYGYIDENKIYVNINSAKGQIVEGKLTKTRKKRYELTHCNILDYANRENQMYDILEKQLGGCNYQYYTYEEQLQIKTQNIKSALDTIIKNEYIFEKSIESVEKTAYRNKMEFSFGNEVKDGETILGLHKQNSFHDIVDVSYCKLMDNNFNKIYMLVNFLVKKYKLDFYHRLSHVGYLRNLILRKTTTEILVNLICTDQIDANIEKEFLKEFKENLLNLELDNTKIKGIIYTINNKLSDAVFSEKESILYGERDICETLLGLKFNISPYSFFQTNTKTVEKLYSKVLQYVNDINIKDAIIFDLFSGTGTIGQIVSKSAKQVYGIEIVKEAVDKANENCKLNNIQNCKFIAGDVFEQLEKLERADLLIIDPPRAGIGYKTIEKLIKYKTNNIIYVSCNIRSLLDDLKTFQMYDYKVEKVCLVDMFPYTNHVENVVLLTKA